MNTDCLVKVAIEFGTDLSSRARAQQLRRRIAFAIDGGCAPVTIDCQSVRTLSTSFADEVFAILVEERGEDWYSANVKLIGLNKAVSDTISEAIAYRREPA